MSETKVMTAEIRGCEAIPVEAVLSFGTEGSVPGIHFCGLPDSRVLECRSKVRCALHAAGFEVPRRCVEVSLNPMEMRKCGGGVALAIALGILVLSDQIPGELLQDRMFFGDLGVDGSACVARGVACAQRLARQLNLELVTFPSAEVLGCLGVVRTLDNISEARGGAEALGILDPVKVAGGVGEQTRLGEGGYKSTVEMIGAALSRGCRSIALVGPYEAPLSALAKSVVNMLPESEESALENACAYSAAGLSLRRAGLCRPLRSPSPAVSAGGMMGGGRPVIPGEVSLANGGVLVLEDVPSWDKRVLETLRKPLREGVSRLVRVDGTYALPSRFVLVGTFPRDRRAPEVPSLFDAVIEVPGGM